MLRQFAILVCLVSLWTGSARTDEPKTGPIKLEGFPKNWEASLLETKGAFKLVRPPEIIPVQDFADPKKVVVLWVLQVQTDSFNYQDVRKAWGLAVSEYYNRGLRIFLKDADKVLLDESRLTLQGFHPNLRKGDGVRVILETNRDVLDLVRHATISN